jgi:hypothetical protein
MDTQACFKCGTVKPLDQFYKKRSSVNGHAGVCKTCDRVRKDAWIRAHADHNRAKQRAWRAAHPEVVKAHNTFFNARRRGECLASWLLLIEQMLIYDDPPTVTIAETVKTRGKNRQHEDDSTYISVTVQRTYERTSAGLWPVTSTPALSRWRGERSSIDAPELVHTIA